MQVSENKLRGYYRRWRMKYHPKNKGKGVKILFVAESPPNPKGGDTPYFYHIEHNPNLDGTDLCCVMKKALGSSKIDKEGFLKEFQKKGYFLVDIFETAEEKRNYYKKIKRKVNISKDKAKLIRRLSESIMENNPINIVFITKQAIRSITLPFPGWRNNNVKSFKAEIKAIMNGD